MLWGGMVAGWADEAGPPVTDATVERAVSRAVAWLKAERNAAGHWEESGRSGDRDWAGRSALAALALLYAGEDARQADMSRTLDWLAAQKLGGTYTYGLRAHVFALVPGSKYRSVLQDDLDWLLTAVGRTGDGIGAYDYTAPESGRVGRWDNSCTQYGVLGVWMAADAGLGVPNTYWDNVAAHFLRCQSADGGWGYQSAGGSTGSMTAAGLASLFVALDQRYATNPKSAPGLLGAIERGMDWFGREYGPENPHGSGKWQYYYLYGVERVGRASGRKYFGDKDWFRDGAAYLLREQEEKGSFLGGSTRVYDTSWGLMFLCHGRAPLLFNKLQHGFDWDHRLRDVAGLTRFCGHTFERLLNWQIVSLDGPMDDLLEAPVLYMRGESGWGFNPAETQTMRAYCRRGGMLFGVAGKDSEAFRDAFAKLAEEAFPEYALRPLPPTHPLLSGEVYVPIEKPPNMFEVHNGLRTLMLLCTDDIANAWNKYDTRGRERRDFELGANVYQYAVDKATARSRLETPLIERKDVEIKRKLSVARIRYDGNWDVEPYGWVRLGDYLNNETRTRLLVTSGVAFDSPALEDFKIAYITGTGAFDLSEAEQRGLRRFLSGGGTLLGDAAGGAREFARAFEEHVAEALKTRPQSLPPDSFVLTGAGIADAVDLKGVEYRRSSRAAGRGAEYPRLMVFSSRRRMKAIYSRLDLTGGLLGTQIYGIEGYAPEDSLKIVRNMLLYAGLSTSEKAQLQRAR